MLKRCKVLKYCELGRLESFYLLFSYLINTDTSVKQSILEISGKKKTTIDHGDYLHASIKFQSLLMLIFERNQTF